MVQLNEINCIDDPRIARFLSLRDKSKCEDDLFITDSENVVRKLLKTNLEILKILAPAQFYERNMELVKNRLDAEGTFVAGQSLLNKIVGYRLHRGAMALAKKPQGLALESLINDQRDVILVLNGITEAENVGAICRNIAGFGIKSIIVDRQSCHPYVRRAVRVSMGNVFDIKVHETDNLPQTLRELKVKGYKIIAAETTDNAIPLSQVTVPHKCAVVLGSEGQGIYPEVLNETDIVTIIPIVEKVVSLNVACTSSIILYHFSMI